MAITLQALSKEFPKKDVHWRAQALTRDGTKALALAYIDARDVMERLDQVCGMENWQRRYSHANGKTVCEIGIRINNEWIWKADGAGDTDVEAEKGAISDAFKRAAVNWGVGRYLYALKQTWVPCETYQNNQGKQVFSKFTDDCWKYVKATPKTTAKAAIERAQEIGAMLEHAENIDHLSSIWTQHYQELRTLGAGNLEFAEQIKDEMKTKLSKTKLSEVL